MLKKRILTAMVLIMLVFLWFFFTPLALFSFIAATIALLCAWEWSALMGLRKNSQRVFVVTLMGIIMAALHFLWPIDTLWQQETLVTHIRYIFIVSFAWWLLVVLLVLTYPSMSSIWNKSIIIRFVAGVLTLVPPWLAFNVLRSAQYHQTPYYGSILVMIMLSIAIICDVGAYFIGKRFGKHKLIPKVSPNKTVEGLFGGIIASVFLMVLFYYCAGVLQDRLIIYIGLTVVIALFSVIGDLFESMLKREVGLKESGSILPGHGGILDRVDGICTTSPIFTLCYMWMVNL